MDFINEVLTLIFLVDLDVQ